MGEAPFDAAPDAFFTARGGFGRTLKGAGRTDDGGLGLGWLPDRSLMLRRTNVEFPDNGTPVVRPVRKA
jgi:hypothetical protein